MENLLQVDVVAILTCFIGTIVWLVRVEARTKSLENALKVLEINHNALDAKIVDELSQIRQSLVRLETIFGMERGYFNHKDR